jgi:hypothetical protein
MVKVEGYSGVGIAAAGFSLIALQLVWGLQKLFFAKFSNRLSAREPTRFRGANPSEGSG